MTLKRPTRILIVDDNEIMRSLLRNILRNREDYEIVGEASNGALALKLTESLKPDIVCMDVKMPEMDGLDALRHIKNAHPEISIVMITGNASVENVQESQQSGASGFIIKPFNATMVLDTLKRVREAGNPAENH